MGMLIRYITESDENYERAIKWVAGVACTGAFICTVVLMIGILTR
jgi:hypothetical protein